MPRVLLLTTTRSYRAQDFVEAATRLGIEIVRGVDMPDELAGEWPGGFGLDFANSQSAIATIRAHHQQRPFSAILASDDSGTILAALASAALGLAHNSVSAAHAARDKYLMRQALANSGVNSPTFHLVQGQPDLDAIITAVGFPAVVKPLALNGSRGVIRVNDRLELQNAIARITRLLHRVQGLPADQHPALLVERYIPGDEVALEGLLHDGKLQLLTLFVKPDPLEGPYFEETIYVTPSRLDQHTQTAITTATEAAARALGLATGPLHAELRLNGQGPWIVEVAGRSIGGLCSRVLQFGTAASLEELILAQAIGLPPRKVEPPDGARGVMMIPIPAAGLLRAVDGQQRALRQKYITGLEITAPLDNPLVPLPEGDGYLGFIFARGPSATAVEQALRTAHAALTFRIDPLLTLEPL